MPPGEGKSKILWAMFVIGSWSSVANYSISLSLSSWLTFNAVLIWFFVSIYPLPLTPPSRIWPSSTRFFVSQNHLYIWYSSRLSYFAYLLISKVFGKEPCLDLKIFHSSSFWFFDLWTRLILLSEGEKCPKFFSLSY